MTKCRATAARALKQRASGLHFLNTSIFLPIKHCNYFQVPMCQWLRFYYYFFYFNHSPSILFCPSLVISFNCWKIWDCFKTSSTQKWSCHWHWVQVPCFIHSRYAYILYSNTMWCPAALINIAFFSFPTRVINNIQYYLLPDIASIWNTLPHFVSGVVPHLWFPLSFLTRLEPIILTFHDKRQTSSPLLLDVGQYATKQTPSHHSFSLIV